MITKAFDRGHAAGHAAQTARNTGAEPAAKVCPYRRQAQLNAWYYGYSHGERKVLAEMEAKA